MKQKINDSFSGREAHAAKKAVEKIKKELKQREDERKRNKVYGGALKQASTLKATLLKTMEDVKKIEPRFERNNIDYYNSIVSDFMEEKIGSNGKNIKKLRKLRDQNEVAKNICNNLREQTKRE